MTPEQEATARLDALAGALADADVVTTGPTIAPAVLAALDARGWTLVPPDEFPHGTPIEHPERRMLDVLRRGVSFTTEQRADVTRPTPDASPRILPPGGHPSSATDPPA